MGRGAKWDTVHGIAKGRTRLSDYTTTNKLILLVIIFLLNNNIWNVYKKKVKREAKWNKKNLDPKVWWNKEQKSYKITENK